jgi:hypothetical protein
VSALVLNLPDRLTSLLKQEAAQRGETVDAFAESIFDASPLLIEATSNESTDLLEAFLGCGGSGDSRELSIEELRNALSETQLANRG